MSSWRCSNCGLNWPNLRPYETCMGCEKKCWHSNTAEPMTELEAQQLANAFRHDRATEELRLGKHRAFETYYAEHAAAELNAELDSELAKLLC